MVVAGNPAKCIATAEWSVGESCVIPTCKELIPDRSSGQLYYDCNDENGNEVDRQGAQKAKTECKIVCAFGYENVFQKGRTCGEDGNWKGMNQKCRLLNPEKLGDLLAEFPMKEGALVCS